MHINTDAYTCTHLDSDAKSNPTVSNSTVLVIVSLAGKIVCTVGISRSTVVLTAVTLSAHTVIVFFPRARSLAGTWKKIPRCQYFRTHCYR